MTSLSDPNYIPDRILYYLSLDTISGFVGRAAYIQVGMHYDKLRINLNQAQYGMNLILPNYTEQIREWNQYTIVNRAYNDYSIYINGIDKTSEFEIELILSKYSINGNFLESGFLHPLGNSDNEINYYGDLWVWTNSNYLPYKNYKSFEGLFSEYNGKFMCNQFVLKGGSCITPKEHIRASYRNFYYPSDRWQFSGIRLVNE